MISPARFRPSSAGRLRALEDFDIIEIADGGLDPATLACTCFAVLA
jgi:hypothetical protein